MADFRPRSATETRVRSDLSQVTGRAVWDEDGADFLVGQEARQRRGDTIALDPSINRMARALLASVAPAVAEAMDAELRPVAQAAFEQWPIRTGLSKSLLSLEWEVRGPTEFAGGLVNRARYANFIRRGRTGRELVRLPTKEAARRISARLGDTVARTASTALGRV